MKRGDVLGHYVLAASLGRKGLRAGEEWWLAVYAANRDKFLLRLHHNDGDGESTYLFMEEAANLARVETSGILLLGRSKLGDYYYLVFMPGAPSAPLPTREQLEECDALSIAPELQAAAKKEEAGSGEVKKKLESTARTLQDYVKGKKGPDLPN
jgi:hypothetical protein